jgi:nicotinamide mononucleotide (NMN) deamidase PncC
MQNKLLFYIQNEDEGGTKEKKKGEVYLVWEAAGGEDGGHASSELLKEKKEKFAEEGGRERERERERELNSALTTWGG